jgi:outer membrane protein OmpA-like peptidoglycan-associated protein
MPASVRLCGAARQVGPRLARFLILAGVRVSKWAAALVLSLVGPLRATAEPIAELDETRACVLVTPVYFERYSDRLTPGGWLDLRAWIVRIQESGEAFRATVGGHAYDEGDEAWMLDLSRRRAEAVGRALIELGASPDDVETIAFGDARPAFTDRVEYGPGWSRRAELVLEPR